MTRQQSPNSAGQTHLTGVLAGALALVVGSAAVGVAVNHFSPRGIPLLPASIQGAARLSEVVPLPPGVRGVDLAEARDAFDTGSALFLDARPPEDYAESHLPGALNVPAREFDDYFARVVARVEEAERVIIYCDGVECSDSIDIAERLVEFGFSETYVFEPGWRAWLDAGGPAAGGAEP